VLKHLVALLFYFNTCIDLWRNSNGVPLHGSIEYRCSIKKLAIFNQCILETAVCNYIIMVLNSDFTAWRYAWCGLCCPSVSP